MDVDEGPSTRKSMRPRTLTRRSGGNELGSNGSLAGSNDSKEDPAAYRKVLSGTQHTAGGEQQQENGNEAKAGDGMEAPASAFATTLGKGGLGLLQNAGTGGGSCAVERGAVLNMVNGMLGAGLLGFPFCFMTCGILLSFLILVVVYFASEFSLRLLLRSSHVSGKRSYESLGQYALGSFGRRLVKSCILALNLGAIVAFINIVSDVLSSVAGTIIPPAAEPSRNMIMTGVTLLGMMPVTLFVQDEGLLRVVSTLSVGVVALFSLALAIFALAPISGPQPLELWKPSGILVAFPIMSYGFTSHTILFPVYSTLKLREASQMTRVVRRSNLLLLTLYSAVGVCGYLAFRQRTAGDVLRNLGGASVLGLRGAYERLVKSAYGLSILGGTPIVCLPIIDSLLQQGSRGHALRPSSALLRRLVSMAILLLALLLAMTVPNVEFIFGLVGATACSTIAFIMPPLIYLAMPEGAKQLASLGEFSSAPPACRPREVVWRERKAWVLMLFGLAAMVLCTRATLMAVQEEHEVVQLAQELVQRQAALDSSARHEQKVRQAASTVSKVDAAAKTLDTVQDAAAADLQAVKHASSVLSRLGAEGQAAGSGPVALWDVKGQLQKHSKAQEKERERQAALDELGQSLKGIQGRLNSTVQILEKVAEDLDKAASTEDAGSAELPGDNSTEAAASRRAAPHETVAGTTPASEAATAAASSERTAVAQRQHTLPAVSRPSGEGPGRGESKAASAALAAAQAAAPNGSATAAPRAAGSDLVLPAAGSSLGGKAERPGTAASQTRPGERPAKPTREPSTAEGGDDKAAQGTGRVPDRAAEVAEQLQSSRGKGDGGAQPNGRNEEEEHAEELLRAARERARETVGALQDTMRILMDLERAADKLRQARGSGSAEARREAALAVQRAVEMTMQSTSKLDTTRSVLKQAAWTNSYQLLQALLDLTQDLQMDAASQLDLDAAAGSTSSKQQRSGSLAAPHRWTVAPGPAAEAAAFGAGGEAIADAHGHREEAAQPPDDAQDSEQPMVAFSTKARDVISFLSQMVAGMEQQVAGADSAQGLQFEQLVEAAKAAVDVAEVSKHSADQELLGVLTQAKPHQISRAAEIAQELSLGEDDASRARAATAKEDDPSTAAASDFAADTGGSADAQDQAISNATQSREQPTQSAMAAGSVSSTGLLMQRKRSRPNAGSSLNDTHSDRDLAVSSQQLTTTPGPQKRSSHRRLPPPPQPSSSPLEAGTQDVSPTSASTQRPLARSRKVGLGSSA